MSNSLQTPLLIAFLSLFTAIVFYSCDDECNVDCPPPGGSLELRYTHNEENAIFGANAIIPRDSILFHIMDQPGKRGDLLFIDSTKAIRLFLVPGLTYVLNLGNYHADTFQLTDYIQPRGRCCSITLTLEAEKNGEMICDEGCEDIVEVEI